MLPYYFHLTKESFSDDPNLFHFEYRNYNKLLVNIPCVKQKLRCFKFQCLALVFCAEMEVVSSFSYNHNYNKILKSDWLSTVLISAIIGQNEACLSHWTVRVITLALKWLSLTATKKLSKFLVV